MTHSIDPQTARLLARSDDLIHRSQLAQRHAVVATKRLTALLDGRPPEVTASCSPAEDCIVDERCDHP